MKSLRFLTCLGFYFFLFLTSGAQPLSGSYTIGGSNPDFSGLQQAMDTASVRGVSGPVEFVIRPGTYSGLYNMYQVPGTGPNSKLIFRSESYDSSSVNITGLTNSNQTVMMRLYQLEYVEFHHLGFSLGNSSLNYSTISVNRGKYIGFYHCMIRGFPSSNAQPDFLISGAPDTGYVVKQCYFAQSGGGLFVSNSAFSFRHALIERNVFDYVGSESIYVNGGAFTQIRNNIINVGGGGTATGILMSGTSRYEISGNRIYHLAGTLNSAVVQLISSSGWPTQKSRIFNNVFFIQAGTTFVAYNFRSSSSSNLEIANNTFYMNGGASAHVFYLQGSFSSGAEIDIHNNIFYRNDTIPSNHIFRIPNLSSYLSAVRSNHNVFFSHAPVFNAEYSTFADYQAIGIDSNSVYADPQFLADSLLKFQNPLLENTGTPLPWLITDIDGNFRHALHPDPGAYESISAPVASLGSDTTACGSFVLQANAAGASVLWNDGSTQDSLEVFQTGWYVLTLSNVAGSSSDSVFVNIQYPDTVSISASSALVCPGASVGLTLNSQTTGNFLWSDTASTSLYRTVVINEDTVFSGVWVALNGCSTEISVPVNVFTLDPVSLILPDSVWCSNAGIYLLSGGLPAGGVYSGLNISGNQLDPSSIAGLWAVVNYAYTDTNSCSSTSSDSIYVDVCSAVEDFKFSENGVHASLLTSWLNAHPDACVRAVFNNAGQYSSSGFSVESFFTGFTPGVYVVMISYRRDVFPVKILVAQ